MSSTTQGQRTAMLLTSVSFSFCHIAVIRLKSTYPGGRSGFFITPQVVMIYALLALGTLLLRIEVSRLILIISGFSTLIWFNIEHLATAKYRRLKLAVVDVGNVGRIFELHNIDARRLSKLNLEGVRYDAVIADFHHLDANVERFLTACALNRIAVYDAKVVAESFSGRVKIDRMSENNIGALLPTRAYERMKLLIDWFVIVATLPVVLPIVAVTAALIKLESPGPIIYTQTRVGQGNRPFTIYKFRSMRFDRSTQARFAGQDDPRVTKVGRVIRKLRIDELPQFLNVLKGEMSLIGPRPEQPEFVNEFDKKIPFYSYRHVVKPGITGWAQVHQGYATNTDETRVKIEHDFYYIKNCSLYLDFVVVLLTLRTMLTGFGAR